MNPMTRSDHLFGPLFSLPECEVMWSTETFLRHFKAFEIALARAAANAGLVSAEQADMAVADIANFEPDMAALAEGVRRDGLSVPEFVRQLKACAREGALPAIHIGTTSQDLIDSAMSLILRAANESIDLKLAELVRALQVLEAQWGDKLLMGRTRMQAALPITVRDRLETWHVPLSGHRVRLNDLRPQVEVLQFGGAVGDRSAVAPHGAEMAGSMGEDLGLNDPGRCWHTTRAALSDYAGWLSLVTGSLGKMGQDITLMAQQGIGEISLSGGGSSSAMAHKQNPVLAETLVALARFNAAQLPLMHGALVHEQERSGVAWTTEWMALPAMVNATVTGLTHANALVGSILGIGKTDA